MRWEDAPGLGTKSVMGINICCEVLEPVGDVDYWGGGLALVCQSFGQFFSVYFRLLACLRTFYFVVHLISSTRGKTYLFGLRRVDSKTNTGYLFKNASWAYSGAGMLLLSGLPPPPTTPPPLLSSPLTHDFAPLFSPSFR